MIKMRCLWEFVFYLKRIGIWNDLFDFSIYDILFAYYDAFIGDWKNQIVRRLTRATKEVLEAVFQSSSIDLPDSILAQNF